ncbi:hypothetical protein [Brevundimonas nasdae]|uniref:Uncharacterized protein n=1 Tax=Brevundimonas nasdae TaxID=172043 RepID=A0ACD4VPL2_9CAUL|nr:hypothetical protein [Brevundimonas nasdae]WOB78464.1 hypothetical protein PZA08_14345 [Brevundimonas nasdae]
MTVTQTFGTAVSGGFWSPQIIAAIISAGVSIITLMVVGTIAYRQWMTARDKVAVDLFDRRLQAWQDFTRATVTCLDFTAQPTVKEWEDYLPRWRPLDEASANARFLFGPEVADQMSDLAARLMTAPWAHTDRNGERESTMAILGYTKWQMDTTMQRDVIARLVEPYMMLNKIGVSRPRKPYRWPWKPKP